MAPRSAAITAAALLTMLHFTIRAVAGQAATEPGCATVYVINHGWHAGIAISAEDFAPRAFFREAQFADRRWLEFGWGDAAFYQTPNAGLALALRALFTPTDTVMHVIGFDNPPTRAYPALETLALRLPQVGYHAVLGHIKGSFDPAPDGHPTLSQGGRDGRSAFFRARGSYHIRRTCNTWLAEALAKGGLPLDPDAAARVEDLLAQLRALRWEGCKAMLDAQQRQEE